MVATYECEWERTNKDAGMMKEGKKRAGRLQISHEVQQTYYIQNDRRMPRRNSWYAQLMPFFCFLLPLSLVSSLIAPLCPIPHPQ